MSRREPLPPEIMEIIKEAEKKKWESRRTNMKCIKLSEFLNPENKIAINCQTEEEAKNFLCALGKLGVEWSSGRKLEEATYFDYSLRYTLYFMLDKKHLAFSSCESNYSRDLHAYTYRNNCIIDDVSAPSKNKTIEEDLDEIAPERLAECCIISAMRHLQASLEGVTDGEFATKITYCICKLSDRLNILLASDRGGNS